MNTTKAVSSKPANKAKGTRTLTKTEATALKANLQIPADKHEITEEQRKADRRADEQVKTDAMSQFVAQTLNTAPLTTPPSAQAAFEKDLAELKAKHGITATVKVSAPKVAKVQSNGVTRPAAETTCGKIWSTADAISAATHGVCPIAALKEHADMKGINEHTIKTQYAKWRMFNGVTGRLPRIHAVHQTAGEYEGLTPAVPKAE